MHKLYVKYVERINESINYRFINSLGDQTFAYVTLAHVKLAHTDASKHGANT